MRRSGVYFIRASRPGRAGSPEKVAQYCVHGGVPAELAMGLALFCSGDFVLLCTLDSGRARVLVDAVAADWILCSSSVVCANTAHLG